MRILVSGASGLVGSAISRRLARDGHEVVPLVRGDRRGAAGVWWDPDFGEIDAAGLEGMDAVVHLAGDNIASGRWTARKKKRILDSRVDGTATLCEAITSLERKPRVLLSASAVGYYGNRDDAELTEGSAMGIGFLPEVCRDWESATKPALLAGMRVVEMRFGMVLSATGGALAKMLRIFRLGLGGRLGSGDQWISWIATADLVEAIAFALERDDVRGPVNFVAPEPVTNAEFTRTLGRVLRRPTPFPAPAFLLRLVFGEMADALLLSSTRAVPRRLLGAGFEFRFPRLEPALAHELEAGAS